MSGQPERDPRNELRQFTVGQLGTNCYAFVSEGECLVVDPGDSGADIADALEDVEVKLVVATHGHGDHVSGVAALVEETGAPFAMAEADVELATHATETSRWADEDAPRPDRILSDGDVIHVGSTDFHVLAAPGHTPGGIALLGPGVAFVGDTIFAGSCGRTDLPGGDHDTLMETLSRLSRLIPASTVLCCGHGDMTTMEHELKSNPWLKAGPRESDGVH